MYLKVQYKMSCCKYSRISTPFYSGNSDQWFGCWQVAGMQKMVEKSLITKKLRYLEWST